MKSCAVFFLAWAVSFLALAKESIPVLEYRFQQDAKDSSGQNLDGTVHGDPGFASVDGRAALVLDGVSDWVEAGAKMPALAAEFSIECWVRPAALQAANADLFGNHTHAGQGFVLQQDAGNTNAFAFNYGNGAGGWIHTKPIQLVAERWQHVAMVKSATELKFFLNGMLVDTVAAASPVIASPLSFRIGLGFEDESRCFQGAIAEFRIWNHALSEVKPEVSAAQKLEALANNASVQLASASASRIFNPDHPPAIELQFKGGTLLEAMSVIEAVFECEDLAGKRSEIAPVNLTASNGFRQSLALPLAPGYYRLTCKAAINGPGGSHVLKPATIAFAVLEDAAANAVPPSSTSSAVFGTALTQTLSLDGEDWLIATDPTNVGRAEQWFNAPVAGAKTTRVPWIIQDVFPDYHGVAWYWRDFAAPVHPHGDGRFILRFGAVDYLAEVWVNGVRIGQHEGAEAPFEFDVTGAIKPGAVNRLAVRVLNPTHEPIEGIALSATAKGPKTYPVAPGSTYNVGGIVDSVALLATPIVRVEDLQVKPDWKSGRVRIEANLRNASDRPIKIATRFAIAPARGGETLDAVVIESEAPPGDSRVKADVVVASWQLWSPDDPFLYEVKCQAGVAGTASLDERATQCGFRDFRFENNAFRLNGKRFYIQGALILPHYPVGFRLPPREDFLRRDVLAAKAMGLNLIRVIWGGLRARDLDVFDELGALVQQEHMGAVHMADGPELERRFEASLSGMIRRDRQHPSIVIWSVLNEMWDGAQFRHGVASLPLIKHLDDTRLCLLNSGGFDMQMSIGSLSNPGATEWQHLMGSEAPDGPNLSYAASYGAMLDNRAPVKADIHPYQPVPHTAVEIGRMRTLGSTALPGRKIVISEIGTGCAVNLPRYARHYEQMGATHADDARYYRDKFDHFMTDWKQWNLGRIWSQPEDFFLDSERNMIALRRETGNALRANPHLAGYTFCALTDSDFNGVGLINGFREFKTGALELQQDLTAPVRWCLFAEPSNVYSGASVKLEALLSNLDALPAGDYPVTVEVVAPDGDRVFAEKLSLTIPAPSSSAEAPLVRPVFAKDVPITGPTGSYRFLVHFEHGAVATGGEIEFQVFHADDMPPVASEVVLWGKDDALAAWLAGQKIRTRPFASPAPNHRELILAGAGSGDVTAFRELAARMARGSTVIFLSPAVFARDTNPLGFLPLATKGTPTSTDFGGYYRGDTFAPMHPVFAGLSSGGILNYTLYLNILSQGGVGITGGRVPDDLIVAGIRAQFGYASVIQTAGYPFGSGRFIFNTLRIAENLGTDPVAERLLRNLLNHAAQDISKPLAELPADFDQQLKAIGYE